MSSNIGAGKTVLVTGINGYIAAHIGQLLLKRGYTLRGASRSGAAKEKLLAEAFRGYEDRYEHVVVPDITAPGAFDAAVQGVWGIIHTASPIGFSLKTVDEFMVPAVNGVKRILESVKTTDSGKRMGAFVLTSSVAAIVDFTKPDDYDFSEEDWNENGERIAREKFMPGPAYGASKAAAERALWNWREENQPSFSVSAVNPGVVTGPPVVWPAGPEGLNETLKPIWRIYSGEAKEVPPGIGGQSYIDVRDVAALHVWCLEHGDKSDGQRYLAANGKGTMQAAADILRREFPGREIVVGKPESDYVPKTYDYPKGTRTLRATKAYKAMGVESFRGYEESLLDTVKAFEERWPGLASRKS